MDTEFGKVIIKNLSDTLLSRQKLAFCHTNGGK